MTESTYNATLLTREQISDRLIIMRVKPDLAIAHFLAGQFATVGLMNTAPRFDAQHDEHTAKTPPKLIRKAYSIASAPTTTEYLEFYVALVPEGALTPRLFALNPGDRLYVGPKIAGKFTLDDIPQHKHLLLISTGTGLAPFISMIRSQLVCGGDRKFVILHGARTVNELGYFQELSLLGRHCHNLTYMPTLSRATVNDHWAGLTGRVTTHLEPSLFKSRTNLALTPSTFEALLCGGPDMIESVRQILEPLGFDETTIHTEKYW